jgi:outer membrane protein OmpA-like peptidoglycan-associated protein
MNTEGTASPNPTGTEPAPTPGDDPTGVQSKAQERERLSLRLKNGLAEAAHRIHWRPILDKVRKQGTSSALYAVLTWFVLVLLTGLLGWFIADREEGPSVEQIRQGQPLDERRESVAGIQEAPAGAALTDLKGAIQAAMEHNAAQDKAIAEAKRRIAALEGALDARRKQNEALHRATEEAQPAPRGAQGDLRLQVANLGGRETEGGLAISLTEPDLTFPTGKASLPAGDLPILERIASLLIEHPTVTARVEGHTDASGRAEANLRLSQARADAVKQTLVDRGVTEGRIEAIGFGETRPLADNGTKAGSLRNRRIEVYLIDGAN